MNERDCLKEKFEECNMDQISIIVPIYNVGKYLNRCVDSIINQTYKNIQIILVDDGSKDESICICDEYARKYSNINVIHKKNAGLGYARNSGLEVATGKYVAFVDGDDYILPKTIQTYYEAILSSGADTCISGYRKIKKNKTEELHENPYSGKIFAGKEINEQVLPRMMGTLSDGTDYIEMSVCMGLMSLDIINSHSIRFYSEKEYISEDLLFDFDYYPHAKRVVCSYSTGYCYCDNEGSLTTSYRPDRFEKQVQLFKKEMELTKALGIYDVSIKRMATTLISIARYSIKLEQKFGKVNGEKIARERIEEICRDSTLRGVWQYYDNSKAPLKSRPINYFIKNENVFALWNIMKFKNIFDV